MYLFSLEGPSQYNVIAYATAVVAVVIVVKLIIIIIIIIIIIKKSKVKLSLEQAVETNRVVRHQGPHIL
jgi:hypothetical protein